MSYRAKLYLSFAAVYLIWGSTYLAIVYAIETIPPFFMAGCRFILAGSALYLWSLKQDRANRATTTNSTPQNTRPTVRQWRNAFIVGAFLLLGGNGLVVWAEQTVPSGIAALLIATEPFFLVLCNWARPGGERPSVGVMIGVLVGIAGMIQLIGLDGLMGHGAIPLAGTIALVVASLSWAIGTLIGRSADIPHTIKGTGMEMIGGGVLLFAFSLVSGELFTVQLAHISWSSILGFLYLTIFGSLCAYTAYSWLMRNAGPAAIGTYAYVNPVVAVFLGWLIAGESITKQTLFGAAIIVVAVVVITTTQGRRKNITNG